VTEEDLVTWGENEKIAYLEKEVASLMQDNRILNDIIERQDDKIEELVKRMRNLAVQQSFELVRKAVM
jgi:predicted RNase H-like nuclease (RuvC/YqgF family)|tara:strand:- start:41 stop:244 length:204 start_codon:yes stop_codon:yes gene_type:complete